MLLEARADAAEALSFLGYRGQQLDSLLQERLDGALELCADLAPQGAARSFEIAENVGAFVALAGTSLVLEGVDIARHLQGAREVSIMVSTLGLRSEQLLVRSLARSTTDGLLLDACASSLAERAAGALFGVVAKRARERNLIAGPRFSPGYGDFPLSVQGALLSAVGADKMLGVSVTRASLLVPPKSVTAVCGLYEPGVPLPRDPAKVAAEEAEILANTGENPVHAAAAAGAEGAAAPSVAPAQLRRCETCAMARTCLLRAQGRTCYGSN